MEYNQKGSKAYLITIVMVAVLGGLLFGYDTAVISGAEKGLQAVCQVGCEIPGLNLGTAFETGRLESCRGG